MRSRFPRRRRIAGGRHWTAYAVERRDGAYLLLDASGLAPVLHPDDRVLLGGLVDVLRFAGAEDRDAYARRRGWS